jgi:hypothetical protein
MRVFVTCTFVRSILGVVKLNRLRRVVDIDSVDMKCVIGLFEKHEEVSPKVNCKKWTRFQYMSLGIFTVHSSDSIPSCQKFPVYIVNENSSTVYPEPDLKLLSSAHGTFRCLLIFLILATHYAVSFPSLLSST